MVTTRRQIRTEQDRFGGYTTRQAINSDIERNQIEYDKEQVANIQSEQSYAPSFRSAPPSHAEVQASAPSFYSARKDYPDTAEFIGSVDYPVRRKKSVKREIEDVMPSIKTRAVLSDYVSKQNAAEANKKEKSALKSKTKAMLGIYMVVVVALAAIVIATGIAISGLGSSVASLESELALKSVLVTQQNAELSALDNDTMMTGQATDIGMVKPSQKTEVELLPVGDVVNYEARTNWFDKFCDWLSNLIGG